MSKGSGGGTCRTVCWLLGVAVGGYLAYALVVDGGFDQLQSGVLGLLAMLVVGMLTRALFCRGGSRVKARVAEAQARERVAEGAKPGAKPGAKDKGKAARPEKAAAKADRPAKPARTELDATMEEIKATVEAEMAASKPARKGAAAAIAAEAAVSGVKAAATPAKPAKSEAPVLVMGSSERVDPPADGTPATPAPVQPEKPKPSPAEEKAIDTAVDAAVSGADWDAAEEEEFQALITEAEPATPEPAPEAPVAAPEVAPEVVETTAEKPEPAADAPAEPAPEPAPAPAPPPPKPAAEPAAPEAGDIRPMEPRGLDAPDGTPDDLKAIEGIGEAEEQALNAAGIYHYAQFVGMNRRELAWIDMHVASGNEADNWRKQAIQLARQAG
jgi:predicted flap endonuclease-1-like 5' DNA nuclease